MKNNIRGKTFNRKQAWCQFLQVATLATSVGVIVSAPAALAWKPTTHVYLAEQALNDALDDGMVTINRVNYATGEIVGEIGKYPVDPAILSALRSSPAQYRAGVLGPDAYPDVLTGQQVIHPRNTNAWLEHLWKQSNESPAIKAFVLGYLTHAAGDMYGHTFVNYFTGDHFTFEPPTNATKHIVLEGYIDKKAPTPTYEASIAGVEDFIYQQLINATPGSHLDNELMRKGSEGSKNSIPRIYSTLRFNPSLTGADRNVLGVQLLLNPIENVLTGLTYVNAFSSDGSLGTFTGSANAESSGLWSNASLGPRSETSESGFPCCSTPGRDLPARTHAIGATLQWRLASNLTFAAWGGLTFTNFLDSLPSGVEPAASVGQKPFANTATYLFSLGLSDPFGREGDLLAFLVGQPPKLVGAGPETVGVPVPFFEIPRRGEPETPVTDNNPDIKDKESKVGVPDQATSFHFEVFYRFRLSDNIYITPGFFYITNPGHIASNNDIFIGTLRTLFRF